MNILYIDWELINFKNFDFPSIILIVIFLRNGGGAVTGEVDNSGQFTGDNFIYLYPGLSFNIYKK